MHATACRPPPSPSSTLPMCSCTSLAFCPARSPAQAGISPGHLLLPLGRLLWVPQVLLAGTGWCSPARARGWLKLAKLIRRQGFQGLPPPSNAAAGLGCSVKPPTVQVISFSHKILLLQPQAPSRQQRCCITPGRVEQPMICGGMPTPAASFRVSARFIPIWMGQHRAIATPSPGDVSRAGANQSQSWEPLLPCTVPCRCSALRPRDTSRHLASGRTAPSRLCVPNITFDTWLAGSLQMLFSHPVTSPATADPGSYGALTKASLLVF